MAKRIYVGNLPWSYGSTELEQLFKQYGDVAAAEVIMDRETGRSRGFGFVYFTSTRAAQKAKEKMADVNIDGMKVRIDYSVTRGGGPKWAFVWTPHSSNTPLQPPPLQEGLFAAAESAPPSLALPHSQPSQVGREEGKDPRRGKLPAPP